jgi:hypothetical protein
MFDDGQVICRSRAAFACSSWFSLLDSDRRGWDVFGLWRNFLNFLSQPTTDLAPYYLTLSPYRTHLREENESFFFGGGLCSQTYHHIL